VKRVENGGAGVLFLKEVALLEGTAWVRGECQSASTKGLTERNCSSGDVCRERYAAKISQKNKCGLVVGIHALARRIPRRARFLTLSKVRSPAGDR
jgi:hypothetical protein